MALAPVLGSAVVMGLVLLIGAPEIARLTNPSAPHEATQALRALALLVPFVGLESVLLSATRGLGLMRPYVVTEQILRPTLQLVAAVLIGAAFNSSLDEFFPKLSGIHHNAPDTVEDTPTAKNAQSSTLAGIRALRRGKSQ